MAATLAFFLTAISKNKTIKVTFRKFGIAGTSIGGRIYVNRTMNIDDILTNLVHEGRHQLDKIQGTIPWRNPGGSVSVFAEMRAWSSSANFAYRNNFSKSHSQFYGAWNNPKRLAGDLGNSPDYFRQFGGEPTDLQLLEAVDMFLRTQ